MRLERYRRFSTAPAARRRTLARRAAAALLGLLVAPGLWAQGAEGRFWTDVPASEVPTAEEPPSGGPSTRRGGEPPARWVVPERYRAVDVERTLLASLLDAAPPEGAGLAADAGLALELPLPDGGSGRFRVEDSPVMAPGLARRYPEIRTFAATGLDDPSRTARLDLTPAGFHAQIFGPEGTVYIDPWAPGDDLHLVYRRRDHPAPPWAGDWTCQVDGGPGGEPPAGAGSRPGGEAAAPAPAGALTGPTLSTYRLAVAATGEYTAFHGGTKAQALAAIVTAMNRVNGIYERDVAIRMVLVANNDDVIYTSPDDPYTNNIGFLMLLENQSNLDMVIGSANYDIGHVFSTGGGGRAYLGVPCRDGQKAKGVTGLSSPTGDPFYVDYVSHEMGHQWGALHTFNSDVEKDPPCLENRTASTAYEPGSGSTIMSYSGICAPQNLQDNSDDYFHVASLASIVAYSTAGSGAACAVTSATGNGAPEVTVGGPTTLPISTPFRLSTASTDPDGDPLTFTFEQYDLGPAGAPDAPAGDAPIFRSFRPSPAEERIFPKLDDLLANTTTIGEILPSYARTLHFRVTARDNRPGGGGVTWEEIAIPVTDLAGPFLVTSPNTAVTWMGFDSELVTWDVAGTDSPPVSCSDVDIQLSTDGGLTFPTALLSSTPNDGAETVVVANLPTTEARLRVICADSEFFDLSDADFTVLEDLPPAVTVSAPAEDAAFGVAESIGFSGSAVDAEDGDLTAGLAWSSDLDGALGAGGSFSAGLATIGYHTVTSGVSDSHGQLGTGTVHVVVEDPPGCPATVAVTIDTPAGSTTYRAAGSVTFGPSVTLGATSDVTAVAGGAVVLENGVSIAGAFSATVTPTPCP